MVTDNNQHSSSGEPNRIKFTPNQVGADLLDSFSREMYNNSYAFVRELVQNAIDSPSHIVTVAVSSDDVTVSDEGEGMNYEEVVTALSVGISPKLGDPGMVGFRGVGIYSAYGSCKGMIIRTKKKNTSNVLVVRIDFEAMRKQVAIERKNVDEARKTSKQAARKVKRTNLLDLLTNHNTVEEQQADSDLLHSSYTRVTLQGVDPDVLEELRKTSKLRQYVRDNLPVQFSEQFPFYDQVKEQIEKEAKHDAAIVRLFVDGNNQVVTKYCSMELQNPITGILADENNEPIAYYWAALSKKRAQISKQTCPDDTTNYEGLLFRMKGFAVGNRRKIQGLRKWGHSGLYDWYTGEVYVTDPLVKTTSNREDFVDSAATRRLYKEVRKITIKLEEEGRDFYVRSRFELVLSRCERIMNTLRENQDLTTTERVEKLQKVVRYLRRPPSQRIVEKHGLANLRKRSQSLLTEAREELKAMTTQERVANQRAASQSKAFASNTGTRTESATSSGGTTNQETSRGSEWQMSYMTNEEPTTVENKAQISSDSSGGNAQASAEGTKEGTKSATQSTQSTTATQQTASATTTRDVTNSFPTIVEVLTEVGWNVNAETAEFVAALQPSLDRTIASNKNNYTKFVKDLRTQLVKAVQQRRGRGQS